MGLTVPDTVELLYELRQDGRGRAAGRPDAWRNAPTPSAAAAAECGTKEDDDWNAILQVKHLTHTYGAGTPFQRSAVEDMSFEIERRGISGRHRPYRFREIHPDPASQRPSEAHRRTDSPATGRDIWAEPKKIRDVRFRVGLVFQYPEYQLFEETVYKDIAFGPTNMGQNRGRAGSRGCGRLPRLVGIPGRACWTSPPLSSPADRSAGWRMAGVHGHGAGGADSGRAHRRAGPRRAGEPDGQHPGLPPQPSGGTVILVSHSMDEIARECGPDSGAEGCPCSDAGHAEGGFRPGGGAALRRTGCAAGDPGGHGAAASGACTLTRRSTRWRSWSGRLLAAPERAVRHAEGHYAGTVFPRDTPLPTGWTPGRKFCW